MRGMKIAIISLIIGFSFVVACARTAPPPAAKTQPAAPTLATEVLEEGKALFDKKCAACHGSSGEGTSIAPKIASHNVAATEMQVRNPMSKMPAFPPSQISDTELGKIASYVYSLSPPAMAMMEWEKAASEALHLWMALLDLKNNDAAFALHHLKDILTFVKEPKHKVQVEKAISMISQGKMHDAEHEIEGMAGSESPSGISMQRFHLELTTKAIKAKDLSSIKHHMEHYMDKATEKQKSIARELLENVGKGDFHEAEHELEELIKG